MSTLPPEYRNPVYHFRGPSTYGSPYAITDAALKNYNVSRDLFGSTTIILSQNSSFNVKDYQYVVEKDASGNAIAVGMYFLPVSDNSFVLDTNGNPVAGSQMVDDYIRSKSGLGPDDDIYVLISYMHPELNQGTIPALSLTDKNNLGFTHMGAYLGKGITSNSPVSYHDHRFGCKWGGILGTTCGYPCNIHIVGLKGVDQKVFNRNCKLVDLLVGHGLEFPGDYKNSMFRPVFINAALMYYRDWLMQESYLMQDSTWYFYCAANKLTVLNIACNLPHNQKSFQEVYGDVEGAKLWKQFLSRYSNATGFDFYYYPGLETDFIPLWKQEGLSPADIMPFTIEQYNAYDQHRRTGTPYNGPAPALPPKAVVCDAQSTADIVYEFIQIYGDPYDAGPLSTIGILWGWMTPILQRTGISELEYLKYALGISQKLAYEYARTGAAATPSPTWSTSPWFWATYAILVNIFGGTGNQTAGKQNSQQVQSMIDRDLKAEEMAQLAASSEPPTPAMLAAYTLLEVIKKWDTIMAGGIVSNEDAYIEFMKAAQIIFDEAKEIVVTNPDKIQFNIIPVFFNLISNGLYSKNDLIHVETICTAVDMSELELKK